LLLQQMHTFVGQARASSAHRVRDIGQQAKVAGPLDRLDENALVPGACAGDAFRDDPSLLGDKPLKTLVVLEVDVHFLAFAEPADALLAQLLSSLVVAWS